MKSVAATSLAVIALVSSAGVLSAVLMGKMNWSIAIPFTSGAVAAMFLISAIAHRFSGARLQQTFATLSGCIAVCMMIIKGFYVDCKLRPIMVPGLNKG